MADEGRPGDRGQTSLIDGVCYAVGRLQPNMKILGSFACVAAHTADGYVLWSNKRQVVDDVFPRGPSTTDWPNRRKLITAVDARKVSASNVKREFSRDSPLIAQGDVRGSGIHAA